jgi:hypothetical protein
MQHFVETVPADLLTRAPISIVDFKIELSAGVVLTSFGMLLCLTPDDAAPCPRQLHCNALILRQPRISQETIYGALHVTSTGPEPVGLETADDVESVDIVERGLLTKLVARSVEGDLPEEDGSLLEVVRFEMNSGSPIPDSCEVFTLGYEAEVSGIGSQHISLSWCEIPRLQLFDGCWCAGLALRRDALGPVIRSLRRSVESVIAEHSAVGGLFQELSIGARVHSHNTVEGRTTFCPQATGVEEIGEPIGHAIERGAATFTPSFELEVVEVRKLLEDATVQL